MSSITPADIAAALGRPAPAQDSADYAQWSMWISDALMLIEARLGDLSALNPTRLDYVVREAVVAMVRRPDDSTQVDVAIDDGRVSRRYSSSAGRVAIDEDWWADLGLSLAAGAWTHQAGPRGSQSYMWTGPDTWVPLP